MADISHKDFGDGKAPSKLVGDLDRRWWTLKDDSAADSVTATIKVLQEHQSLRQLQHTISARLYQNMAIMGQSGISYKLSAANPVLRERISFNVVGSCIDSVTARMAKNKPKPMFLPSNGDYTSHRQAKRLNSFVDGIFYEQEAHKTGPLRFRDGAVFGDGIMHVFRDKENRVAFEHCLPGELWVDEMEAFYGRPRQLHRVKDIDKAVLIDKWPRFEKEIREASASTWDEPSVHPNVSDMVRVRESWHLPSGPKTGDGAHMISISGKVLQREDYDEDCFPFARFRWSPRLYGFWSQGLAEQLQNIQLEINKLMWVVQRSFQIAGTFKVFLENGSKIVKEHLSNDLGAIINYTGTPPVYYVPQIVPPEIFNYLAQLVQRAYEQAGISMLSAASTKPAGLNSGIALREYNDIESDRFMIIGQEYENYFMDLGRLAVRVATDIAADEGSYETRAPEARSAKSVKFSKKDLESIEDNFVMQAFPVSALPNNPAERMQTVQEWVQAGWVTPDQAMDLMDMPDLQRAQNLQNAEREYLSEILDKIVDHGEFTAPEPFDDADLARRMALQYYAEGKAHGLEEGRLDKLRQFVQQLDELQMKAMAQAAAAVPQAQPMPPPQSELIPNQPGMQGGNGAMA